MSFFKISEKEDNRLLKYFLTIGITLFFFGVIGNIPLIYMLDANGADLQKGIDTKEMMNILGRNSFFLGILFPFIIGLLSIMLCVKYIHFRKVISLFTSRETIDWKRFFFSFFLYGIIITIFFIISIYDGTSLVWNFNPSTFLMLLLISLFILPIQTTFEEVFFRGYLLKGVHSVFKKGWISVLIISILFASMHMGNPEIEHIGNTLLVYYIMNGIFLGLIVLMDDGLELSMGYHAVNNIFGALIVTNNWQAFQTDALFMDKSAPSFGIENILTLVVIQPILIFIFSKKYKWTNWKEKLMGENN